MHFYITNENIINVEKVVQYIEDIKGVRHSVWLVIEIYRGRGRIRMAFESGWNLTISSVGHLKMSKVMVSAIKNSQDSWAERSAE